MKKILEELKERKIWRTLIAYPSVSFVLLQAVEFFSNNYDLDARYLSAAFIACAALLPVALIWNWYHGETGHQNFRKAEIGAYGLFTLAAISLVGWFWLSTDRGGAGDHGAGARHPLDDRAGLAHLDNTASSAATALLPDCRASPGRPAGLFD